MTIAARIVQPMVHAYQLLLGPFIGGACRFEPSCSHYAMEALAAHGVLRGGWLTIRRLGRCHPFGAHGFDPVPPGGVRDAHR